MNTVKGRIIYTLANENGPLTYAQLASRTGDHEPSIRRAAMQLFREHQIDYSRYDYPVSIALRGTYGK